MVVSHANVTEGNDTYVRVFISTGGTVLTNDQHFQVFSEDRSVEFLRFNHGYGDYTDYFDVEKIGELCKRFPSKPEVTFRVEHWQYIDFYFYGEWKKVDERIYTVTINNNSATRPTISSPISYLELSNGYKLKGRSKAQATISGSGKLGASITECKLKVGSAEYGVSNGGTVTSDAFSSGGSITVSGIVKDSRGFTNTVSETITVLNGFPTLDSFACSTGEYGGAFSYSFTPPVSSFYSKLRIDTVVGSTASEVFTETIGAKNAAYTGTLPVANYLATIYGRYTTTPDTKLRATLLVYEDSGYTKLMNITAPTREINVKIPENDSTRPKIDSISCTPTVVKLGQSNLFIQGKNGIKTNIGATGQYGTQIATRKWVLDDVTYENGGQTAILNVSGNVTITATVTDQRGFSRSQTQTVKYEPYREPSVAPVSGEAAVHVERESGDSMDKLFVSAAKSFSSVAGYNKCELRVRVKAGANSSYPATYTTLLGTTVGNEYNQSSGIDLAKDSIYYVEISVKDSLDGVSAVILAIPTDEVFMDRQGETNSIAFGGYVTENDAFEVYQTAYFRGGMYFDDLSAGKRYKISIGTNGQLTATEVKTTFSLRR